MAIPMAEIARHVGKRVSGYTVKEIADYFGRSSATVSETIMKVEDRLGKDKSLEKTLTSIRKKLVEGKKRKYRISDA